MRAPRVATHKHRCLLARFPPRQMEIKERESHHDSIDPDDGES